VTQAAFALIQKKVIQKSAVDVSRSHLAVCGYRERGDAGAALDKPGRPGEQKREDHLSSWAWLTENMLGKRPEALKCLGSMASRGVYPSVKGRGTLHVTPSDFMFE
jgi:hypothetical protein